jgi:hypothetical protein
VPMKWTFIIKRRMTELVAWCRRKHCPHANAANMQNLTPSELCVVVFVLAASVATHTTMAESFAMQSAAATLGWRPHRRSHISAQDSQRLQIASLWCQAHRRY